MNTYKVTLERKVTMWVKSTFDEIEADSLKDAQKKALEYDEGMRDNNLDPCIEYLYDTEEYITLPENYAMGESQKLLKGTTFMETDNLMPWQVIQFPEEENYQLPCKPQFNKGDTVIGEIDNNVIIGTFEKMTTYNERQYYLISNMLCKHAVKFESIEQYNNIAKKGINYISGKN